MEGFLGEQRFLMRSILEVCEQSKIKPNAEITHLGDFYLKSKCSLVYLISEKA